MEMDKQPSVRNPLLDFVANNPKVLSAHAAWLDAGGERILELLLETVSGGDSFPFTAELHVQATRGAWSAGAAFTSRTLKRLVEISNNRKEAMRLVVQADGALSSAEREVLNKMYGFSQAEIAAIEKGNPLAPKKPRAKKEA